MRLLCGCRHPCAEVTGRAGPGVQAAGTQRTTCCGTAPRRRAQGVASARDNALVDQVGAPPRPHGGRADNARLLAAREDDPARPYARPAAVREMAQFEGAAWRAGALRERECRFQLDEQGQGAAAVVVPRPKAIPIPRSQAHQVGIPVGAEDMVRLVLDTSVPLEVARRGPPCPLGKPAVYPVQSQVKQPTIPVVHLVGPDRLKQLINAPVVLALLPAPLRRGGLHCLAPLS